MKLFARSQKKQILGVDIGTSGIKVVELALEKNRSRLLTYGYSEQKSDIPFSPLEQPKRTAAFLQEICKKAQVKTTTAVSALPLSSVFSAIVSVPYQKDKNRLKQSIQDQVKKLAPLPLEEMITYSTFIDSLKEENLQHVRVLVTGSAKHLVQTYIEIFQRAKLQLKTLDTESFALIRSLIGKDKNSILLADLGATRSNITIVENGIPFYTRSINMGGDQITQDLRTKLQLDLPLAEQMKRDFSVSQAEQFPTFMQTYLQPLLNEMRYALERYHAMETRENGQVEKIILTGGSAHLPNISSFFSRELNRSTYVGDPWARVVYTSQLRPVLEEIGPKMAVAVGLAMREYDA